jgi:hypothetical protein
VATTFAWCVNGIRMGLIGTAISASLALTPPLVPTSDNYTQGLLFMRAAYPELTGRKLGLVLGSPYARNYDVPVHRLRSFALILEEKSGTNDSPHSADTAQIVRANFEFDSHDRLVEFVAIESPFMKSRERDDARAMILAHSGWSPTQLGMALKEKGARFYPPDEEPMRRQVELVLARLTPLLGSGRVSGIEWLQRDEPLWRTQVRLQNRGSNSTYQMIWEPFDGKLVALRRLEP